MKSKRKSPQNRVNHPHKGGVEWKRILEGHWLNNGNIINLNSSQQDNSPQISSTKMHLEHEGEQDVVLALALLQGGEVGCKQ